MYKLPKLPAPPRYGNLLINRTSALNNIPAVTFSHWRHRLLYTCRVCHTELEFDMKANATEITEEKNRKGEFCGACHNGKHAFGHNEKNCKRCHNGDLNMGKRLFNELMKLPESNYGNMIDWSRALKKRIISPKKSIRDDNYAHMPFGREFEITSSISMIPPAVFSHKEHLEWLDCNDCHPDIFKIKKTTTVFSMDEILAGKFCGVCHLNVAFPVHDCTRCHPKMISK